MAWELVTKSEVSDYVQVPESSLVDDYYNGALQVISEHTGEYYIGSDGVSITDIINGNGRTSITVTKPPIISLTSVSIDGYAIDNSTLGTTKSTIYFKTNPALVSSLLYVPGIFSKGRGNVTISYVAGMPLASVPDHYKLALMLILREILVVPRSEGSDARLQFTVPDYRIMRRETLMQLGIGGKIKQICESLLPAKGKIFVGS